MTPRKKNRTRISVALDSHPQALKLFLQANRLLDNPTAWTVAALEHALPTLIKKHRKGASR